MKMLWVVEMINSYATLHMLKERPDKTKEADNL